MAVAFAENFYSFRKVTRVFGTVFHPRTADWAALADIEDKLVQAHNQYIARQYRDAIQSYQDAQSLIYAQISPGFLGNISSISQLPLSQAVFAPLLSASLEWMNVLPVQQAVPSVRPRAEVNPQQLGSAVELERAGVLSSQATKPAAVSTIADWQMGHNLQQKGFAHTAQFFMDRAAKLDPDLFRALGQAKAPGAVAVPGDGLGVAAAPGLSFGEYSGSVRRPDLPVPVAEGRALGVLINGKAAQFAWNVGESPPQQQIEQTVFQGRIATKFLPDVLLHPLLPSDLALSLPHDYYYVVPLGLAECYHALGDFAQAETYYFQAASYQYLNQTIEAPYVWQRLATLYLDWGNSLFRQDNPAGALPIYQNVLMANNTAPNSRLYTTVSLKPGADQGRAVIALLANLANITNAGLNPTIAAVIVEVKSQLAKIAGNLDFWGFYRATVPIWTFEYLQSVAINFAQLAVSAERDVIDFWDRADRGTLTRQQLSENYQQSQAEVQAAQLQQAAAQAEASAYAKAQALAQQRAGDAQQNANDYANDSALAIQYQAAQAQVSGGDNGDPNQLNSLADQLMSGQTLSGNRATLAAVDSLAAGRYNRDYEVAALRRQAGEMQTAAAQAQAESAAAAARVTAAAASTTVASLRAQAAQQDLDTFDAQRFTPDVWSRMGDQMWRLYRRYLDMALRAARLMQQAYNFETDQSLTLIKGDYSTDEVNGLLAADALMADIQTFTYNLITSTAGKPQPVKQTISLAQQYGFLFETQFRTTGSMQFETRIEDFDYVYPGTYAGRIEAVEVEVDGIVPVTGISGTLTNNGISAYRLPAALVPPGSNGLKYRVQSKETLVLSDYAARMDAPLVTQDARMLRIFQGAGVASSWQLRLPREINDIDYGALTDVRLTFYYKARFDPDLRDSVLAGLAGLPGINARQRSIPTRWVYPDAFFHFQDTRTLTFTLHQRDFRSNETNPILTSIAVLVGTDGSVPAGNLTVALGTPTHAPVSAKTDAKGIVNSDAGAWVPLAGGTALGDYQISMTAADNPPLAQSLRPIVNVVLIFGYTFTPKA
jgi:hypothetical protein